MNMFGDLQISNYATLMPELWLGISALLLLVYGVSRQLQANRLMILLAIGVLALTFVLELRGFEGKAIIMNGMFVTDGFSLFSKCLLLVSAALVLMLASGWLADQGGRPFEFIVLLLLATLGAMLMISASDMLSLYIGLEMSSLAAYVLASFERDHAKSSEAGLKYFVLGALASGMMLYGISLIYGFAGGTNFSHLSMLFAGGEVASRGVIVGLVLIIVGLCFKLSAVPFHMWTPDVYEGAPTPVVTFFATVPKIAAFSLFTRLIYQPFWELVGSWQQIVIFVSLVSMITGALAAITQSNIKRLLAYSSIGHVGFMLMGLASGTTLGVESMLVYLALYVFMSAGMFGCVLMMRRKHQPLEEISDLAGLSQTQPALAIAIAIFMFSMAGIPPLAGFFGKFYVVYAAVSAGLTWLAVLGVITSVISCYYYLKVVRVMYFDAPSESFDRNMPTLLKAGITLCAATHLLFFILPTPLISQAMHAAEALLH